MAFVLFYNWSILLLLLLLLLLLPLLPNVAVAIPYTIAAVVVVAPSSSLLFSPYIFVVLLHHHPYCCRRYTATLLLLLNCTDMLLLLLLLYRTAVSIRFGSFSFHGSFTRRCNKRNKRRGGRRSVGLMAVLSKCHYCCCCCYYCYFFCSYRPSLFYGNTVYSYGLFVPYYAIVPSVVVFYCLNENE